ncbi:MAG: PAS domain S-box protein, partial [Bacteroidetes bacterium]|nr:PAS domain S-box protein [Bacteroidota bacterium]
ATALEMENDLNTHEVELEMQNEELRATHLKLKHSVDEFIQFFDYAPMAYFILNKDGVIKNLNIKACDLIGNPIKALGKPISTYIDGEANQDDFYRQRNHIFETSLSNQIESKIRKKDGTICHVLIETSFIKDENNNFKHLLSAITDITSQKKTEQQLQYKINELNTFTY